MKTEKTLSSYGSISVDNDDNNEQQVMTREGHHDNARSRQFDTLLRFGFIVTATFFLVVFLFGSKNSDGMGTMPMEQSNKGIFGFLRLGRGTRISSSSSSSSSSTSTGIMEDASIEDIPFPHVDRTEFGSMEPRDIVDSDLFDSSLKSSSSKGVLNVPFPTGAFWTNLVLKEATSDQGLSYPVMGYPYAYKWSSTQLQVSYPPLRRLMDKISVRDIFNPDLKLSTLEEVKSRKIMTFDPLSVTLRFSTATTDNNSSSNNNNNQDYWETYLVQGSPYITLTYNQVTPVLTALSIFTSFECLEEGSGSSCKQIENDDTIALKGTHFEIRTNENLRWIAIASQSITLNYDNIRKTTISSDGDFSGVLRLALLPPPFETKLEYTSQFPSTFPDVESTTAVKRLVCHANTYPIGGKIGWESSNKKKNSALIEFKYDTRTMTKNYNNGGRRCSNENEMLMLALPHHLQVLSSRILLSTKKEFDLTYRTIKGAMTPVIGNEWSYEEPLTTISFDADETLQNAKFLDSTTKRRILEQVHTDMSRVLPTLNENVYGFGKQIARLAQLAHIAHVLETNNTGDDSMTVSITKTLHKFLTSFVSGNNVDKLLYDVNFGGIVSKNGLLDSMDDFGNGWYNDHLFHYGYTLYASAVLGKLNSTFIAEYGPAVDALMLDVINSAGLPPTRYGTNLFPFTRHKSWYDGHSFASGLFPFADGKSMESSGESVNCYYGAYLWSTVRWEKNSERIDFPRLLLAMEIRSVKTYWHMVTSDSETDSYHATDIYNPLFAKNLMVGNVGMMDVTVATWFGIEPLYVHMINYLPVTAITKELFDKSYVTEEFEDIIKPVYDNVEMAWKGYVVCDRAMIEPSAAWSDALKLRSYELDQAISQSQVLYFASTMEGFENPLSSTGGATTTTETNDEKPTSDSDTSSPSESCSENEACADLGLTGLCCPSSSGISLRCCEISDSSQATETETTTSTGEESTSTAASPSFVNDASVSSSCAANNGCANLGLVGLCCPTSNGQNLGCCSSH